jgi:hypothetical protein
MHKPPNLPIASQRPLNGWTDEGGLGGRRQPPNPSYRVWDGLGGRLLPRSCLDLTSSPKSPRPAPPSPASLLATAHATRRSSVQPTLMRPNCCQPSEAAAGSSRMRRPPSCRASSPALPALLRSPYSVEPRRELPELPNPVPRVHGRRMAPQSTSNSRRLLHPSSRLRPVTRTFTPGGILPLRHGARHTNLTFSSPHTSYEWSQQ